MDIGFERAGFRTAWANEYDKSISPSFRNHFPHVEFDGRSICDIPDTDIPSPVVGVIGGPPCQSWSEAGARRGIEDKRGQLFYEYLRVIRHCNPLFFVAENVHGLIHRRNSAAFHEIVSLFEQEGYEVSWKLLRASDYGVAQDRERVFIVGYRRSLGMRFEFPKAQERRPTLRDAIGDLGDPGTGKVGNHELLEAGYSPIFMSRNRVRSWDEPSYTILATARHIPFHPQAPKMVRGTGDLMRFPEGSEDRYRRLTIRECARIQSFPDDYDVVYSHPRDGYKMIGNAVPVEMARAIGAKIGADLAAAQAASQVAA